MWDFCGRYQSDSVQIRTTKVILKKKKGDVGDFNGIDDAITGLWYGQRLRGLDGKMFERKEEIKEKNF